MICSIAVTPPSQLIHFGQVTISQDRLQEFIRAELSYFASRHTQAMGKRISSASGQLQYASVFSIQLGLALMIFDGYIMILN